MVVSSTYAQQLPQYSTWLLNPYMYNPAAAGLENTLVANGVYRKQWVDLDGAPVSQHLDAHLPVYFLSSGAGIKIDNDQIGAHQTTQVLLSWNYHIEKGSNLISLGLSAGYQQYSLDGNRLRAPQGDYNDPSFQHNDQWLPQGRINLGAPVFEFGVFYTNKKWELGLSALPVFAPVVSENTPGTFRLTPERHYLFSGSYQIESGDNLVIQPGLLVKSDFAATQMEVSSMLVWKDKFYGIFAYRGFTPSSKDAVVISGGIRINEKTTAIYAYDVPLSALQATNRGSHEIALRYTLDKQLGVGKLPPVIYNPRF
jgi:type IX secretion system PorP/SprF family membrane protein